MGAENSKTAGAAGTTVSGTAAPASGSNPLTAENAKIQQSLINRMVNLETIEESKRTPEQKAELERVKAAIASSKQSIIPNLNAKGGRRRRGRGTRRGKKTLKTRHGKKGHRGSRAH
jgi:hypothetical protein